LEAALKIPAKIKIVISADGVPKEGMFAFIKLVMARRNSFGFLFGPSSASGKVEVTRAQVLQEARKSMQLFLMDYVEIENHWTGKLQITPMNRERATRALSAYRLFRRYEYPQNYEKDLQAAEALLLQLSGQSLSASVQCEAAQQVAVECVAVPAV